MLAFVHDPTVSLWLYDIRSTHSAHTIEAYASTLLPQDIHTALAQSSPAEKTRMRAFSFIMRRVILAAITGTPVDHLTFYNNSYGKPSLSHSDITFNISHSASYWCMAVTRNQEIGVDIERIKKRKNEQKIVQSCFSAEEYEAYLQEPSEAKRTELFFHLWTKKEAIAKMAGRSIFQSLSTPTTAYHCSSTVLQPDHSDDKLILALSTRPLSNA